MRRSTGFLAALLFLVPLAVAQSKAERTQQAAEAYLAEKKVPGFSIAVAQDGKIVFSEGYGFQSIALGFKAIPNTLYRLASVSKPITALAVMREVQEGKVGLDDDIRKYVPAWPNKGHVITVREILDHQSGIRHYVKGRRDGGKAYENCVDALEVFSGDPLLFTPGEKFSYSTHAFTLLGALLEKVEGKPYNTIISEFIRQPAGTKTPRKETRNHPVTNRSELFHMKNGAFAEMHPDDTSWKLPGGGLEATAEDLCNVGVAILENKIVNAATKKEMWTKQKTNDGTTTNRGLGWELVADRVSHSGSQEGAESIFILYPKTHTVIVILSNLQGNPIEQLGYKIGTIWNQN